MIFQRILVYTESSIVFHCQRAFQTTDTAKVPTIDLHKFCAGVSAPHSYAAAAAAIHEKQFGNTKREPAATRKRVQLLDGSFCNNKIHAPYDTGDFFS